ncbi:ribosomal protein S18-alanine N-acetyltransferase [Acholeplasma granularum]|uniref:ribosomal protein S18-alanine N-acetyltransferase n=1 Tax=Acholeplasma granularum TaxID=264635 RepID=UPI0004B1CF44|nr:ribosomal protein S18-alanine N-acetyltransferase [Acholeplasma granularum]
MIRTATIHDIESIVHLENKVFGHSLGYSFLRQELLENEFSKIYVYTKNNQIIAYISFRQIDSNADIMNFLVDIPYQNQGIGSKLFEYALLEMKETNVTSLVLEVRHSNLNAIKFYEKYGATIISTIPNYYDTEDGYMMLMEVK